MTDDYGEEFVYIHNCIIKNTQISLQANTVMPWLLKSENLQSYIVLNNSPFFNAV